MNIKSFAVAVVAAVMAWTVPAASLDKTTEEWTTTVSVSRGQEHTFWVDGLSEDTGVMSIEVVGVYKYKEEGETYEDEISAGQSTVTYDGDGNISGIYVLLSSDDWEWGSGVPSKLTFKVIVSGFYDEDDAANNKFSFHHESGSDKYPEEVDPPAPAVPVGAADNPAPLTINGAPTNPTSASYTPPEDESYYFKTTLTEGRKYLFGIQGGALSIGYAQGGSNLFDDDALSRPYTNALEWSDCNQAYVLVPSATSTYSLLASASGKFVLRTAVFPTRTPDKHTIAATLADGGSVQVQPGHFHDPASGFYDAVIDESLCVFYPEKGASYVFETTGTDSDLTMQLYAKDGSLLAENMYVKDYDQNCRVVFTAPSDSNFSKVSPVYVGVCQRFDHKTLAEEDSEVITAGKVTLSVLKVAKETAKIPLDVVQGDADTSPVFTAGVKPVEDMELSATAWVHTYTIAARAGVTYALKAVSGDDSGLVLGANVYTINAQKKAAGVDTYGSIDPGTDGWLTFSASANAQVYVDVFVESGIWGDGAGLDYGPYDLYATGWKNGTALSPLKVTLMGAPEDKMTWQLDKENAVQYLSGTTALLPAGTYAITPVKIANYAAPAAGSATVPDDAEYVYKYTDTADPLDDWPDTAAMEPKTKSKYKPTSLSPSAKGVSVSRSLWGDEQNYDQADWFTIKAAEGTCYRFVLSGVTGAPRISVYDWNLAGDWDVTKHAVENFVEDDESVFQFAVGAEGKGKTYYLRVAHADENNPVDSAYMLTATSANVGSIKFAKTAVSVKEDAAYVDVAVNRTAKEGKVRVRYRTAEGTAKPGDRYYPASGELVWEDGDSKAKNVRVRLIPDETPTYIDGQAVTFSVILETVEKSELEEGEYLPTISGGDTATVSITETAKKTPGTIQAVCDTPKKPVFTVKAGTSLDIPLQRLAGASGANGVVGVKIDATGKGIDFTVSTNELVWADGETDIITNLTVTAQFATNDYTASKQITVKLTALSGKKGDSVQYEKPTLAASSITINVLNDKFADSMANYAKTVTAAKDGYTVKEGKAGTWVVNANGSFSAPGKGDLTFTFSTTGVFKYTVDGVEKTFTATAKDKTLKIAGANEVSIDEYAIDGTQVALYQGVKYEASFGSEGTVKASKLPDGLKLAQDKKTKEWLLAGTPTKAGIYQVAYTTTIDRNTPAVTSNVCYTVAAAGTSIGTFNGLVYSAGPENGAARVASIAFTSAAGKLSAKVSVGGKSYTFADTGYSWVDDGVPALLHATLAQVQKAGKDTYTNYLSCAIWDADVNDESAWTLENEVVLEMNCLPDAKGSGFQEGIVYDAGRLYRDNSKVAGWVTATAKYAGYYTAALVPTSASEGEPLGNGYLTATIDAKGKAKVAGMLADGTTLSASSVVYLMDNALAVPVYLAKGTSLFAGLIALAEDETGDVVVTPYAVDVPLRWFNDDVNATEWGDAGFAIDVEAVGGWYNTVFNLQRHYLDYAFKVETAAVDELPCELVPDGYGFVPGIGPGGYAVSVAGNTLSTDKQVLVKDASKKYNDLYASVNPQNVQIKYTRATGLVSGGFTLWYEGYNAKGVYEQKSVSGLKHQGVTILSRAKYSALPDDALTAGFFTVDVPFGKRKWKASYPFNIRLEYTGNDFGE